MKNAINSIIRLRSRLTAKDVTLIYACALADVAIVASLIGLIVYFI